MYTPEILHNFIHESRLIGDQFRVQRLVAFKGELVEDPLAKPMDREKRAGIEIPKRVLNRVKGLFPVRSG